MDEPIKLCKFCSKPLKKSRKESVNQWKTRLFCSKSCSAKTKMQSPNEIVVSIRNLGKYAQKGNKPWNKGRLWSQYSKSKMSETRKKLYIEGKITPWNKGKKLGKNPQHSAIMKELFRQGKIINANKSKKVPEWRKEKIRAKVKALWGKPEYRIHMSKAHLGKIPWNKGKPVNEDTRKKLSLAAKGQRRSPKTEFKKGQRVHPSTEFRKGQKPWNYIEGYSPHNRRTGNVQRWKKKVLERDNFICQFCGRKEGLEAHHIKPFSIYPELRHDVSNGITVCKSCHKIQATHQVLKNKESIRRFKELNP